MRVQPNNLVIDGVITPCDWGPNGEVRSIKICGAGEKDYLIAPSPSSAGLFSLIEKRVVIFGELLSLRPGLNTILVKTYTLNNGGEYESN